MSHAAIHHERLAGNVPRAGTEKEHDLSDFLGGPGPLQGSPTDGTPSVFLSEPIGFAVS